MSLSNGQPGGQEFEGMVKPVQDWPRLLKLPQDQQDENPAGDDQIDLGGDRKRVSPLQVVEGRDALVEVSSHSPKL